MTVVRQAAPTKFSSSTGLVGRARVPGDKSISHRALLLGAISEGDTWITNLLRSRDTEATVDAVEALGAQVSEGGDGVVRVLGSGWSGLSEPDDVIDVRNSGTLLRLLPGILASCPFLAMLTGDASIRRRPVDRILLPLREMGADIRARGKDTLPPLVTSGRDLRSIEYRMHIASAQVKSCLLLAGLRADGQTTIHEPMQSRDHTERMLAAAGVEIRTEREDENGVCVKVQASAQLDLQRVLVPGDFSSAAFLILASLLVPDSEITIEGVGMNPTRTALLDVLQSMGADITVNMSDRNDIEPQGTIVSRTSELTAVDIGGPDVAPLIDELPVWLLAAARSQGVSHLRDAGELRVKETDRLRGMAALLRALGVDIEDTEDGLNVHGRPQGWSSGSVSSLGDHRLAMVGAVAGLAADSYVLVDDVGCADISFPGFVDIIERLSLHNGG